jgi:hypothetical protein
VHELQEQEKKCHSDKLEMGRILKDMQERSEEMFREQVSPTSRCRPEADLRRHNWRRTWRLEMI